jgi:hypothetical protein
MVFTLKFPKVVEESEAEKAALRLSWFTISNVWPYPIFVILELINNE